MVSPHVYSLSDFVPAEMPDVSDQGSFPERCALQHTLNGHET